jgi:hypothetical protein
MKIHLLTDYYKNSRPERAAEIDFCITENIISGEFDYIHVFGEDPLPLEQIPDNVVYNPISERLTYEFYINYANNNIPERDIIVLSNADMFFDNSILRVKEIDLSNKVLALTRWCPHHGNWVEGNSVVIYGNHHRSQDVWIWKNKLDTKGVDFNFHIGTLGCDNKVAYQFNLLGYQVWNPSLSIICYHKHAERNDHADHPHMYDSKTQAPLKWLNRPYLLPFACTFEDINTENYPKYRAIE